MAWGSSSLSINVHNPFILLSFITIRANINIGMNVLRLQAFLKGFPELATLSTSRKKPSLGLRFLAKPAIERDPLTIPQRGSLDFTGILGNLLSQLKQYLLEPQSAAQ